MADSKAKGHLPKSTVKPEGKGGQMHVFGPGMQNTDLVTLRSKRAGSLPGNGAPPRSDWLRGKGPEGPTGKA